jgi:1-acyl-sn-glycerol-3-phosphate acyltransferase
MNSKKSGLFPPLTDILDFCLNLSPLHQKHQNLSSYDIPAIFQSLKHDYDKRGLLKDPWGLDLDFCAQVITYLLPLYKNYFQVELKHMAPIEDRPYIIVANHSGQLPIDAICLMMCFLLDIPQPRLLRGMIERFLIRLPFLGEWSQRGGQVLGDRTNCIYLLNRGESVLVFPEGAKGVAKNFWEYYQLKSFGQGIIRMAAMTKIPILPVTIIGAEEMYPYVVQWNWPKKHLHLPAFPLSPSFPLLGPLGVIPRKTNIQIFIEDPYHLPADLGPQSNETLIAHHADEVRGIIQKRIHDEKMKERSS